MRRVRSTPEDVYWKRLRKRYDDIYKTMGRFEVPAPLISGSPRPGDQLIELASSIADKSKEVSGRAEALLGAILGPEREVTNSTRLVEEPWPPFLEVLRSSLQKIEDNLDEIDATLRRIAL